MNDKTNTPEPTQPQDKQPYTTPMLVSYGNIREVTKATGGVTGKNDGGSGKDKTS